MGSTFHTSEPQPPLSSEQLRAQATAASALLPQLRTRVVREARRETWFVVNETDDEIGTIPISLDAGRSIRRVQVNGEVAEFSASPEIVMVRPRRPLRAGQGTIVMVHFR